MYIKKLSQIYKYIGKKIKRLLYTLSTLVVGVLSIVSLASCSNKNNNEPEQLSN